MSDNILTGVILFIIGFLSGLLIGWLYWRQRTQKQGLRLHSSMNEGEQNSADIQVRSVEQAGSALLTDITPSNTPAASQTEIEPDDLKRIEGIGPKISSLLNEAGIRTFSQLAASSVSQLDQIIRKAGISIADPSTWPEQANLAAADDWEALESLQDNLQGGRRV